MILNHSYVPDTSDDFLIFEDDTEVTPNKTVDSWKIMIVDDEQTVHQATQLALKNFIFEGKSLSFLSAYSSTEAMQLITTHSDIAFILLDVVMDTNDAGLRVVRYIREELNNNIVQIILRTGQPGEAPEESVVLNYEINDYKLKVELTRQKLIATAIAALRSYRNAIAILEQTKKLTQISRTLQQSHLQLVQNEKMSAVSNLVAGVAHEIDNPLTFIGGNLNLFQEYTKDLCELLNIYQQKCPQPGREIVDKILEIDLDFLQADLPKLLEGMKQATERMYNISHSLRIFCRTDSSTKVPFDIHEGLDSTILILKHRLEASDIRPQIQLVKDYGELPLIKCLSGQIAQVFMELLANAIDSLELSNIGRSFLEIQANPNIITIKTSFNAKERNVLIQVQDNGAGISPEVKPKIFDHLFTTKPPGKGTGLGLSIARHIVVEKHGGSIEVNSVLEQGAEFSIIIPIES